MYYNSTIFYYYSLLFVLYDSSYHDVTGQCYDASSYFIVMYFGTNTSAEKTDQGFTQYRQLVMEMANLEKGQGMFCHLKLLFLLIAYCMRLRLAFIQFVCIYVECYDFYTP